MGNASDVDCLNHGHGPVHHPPEEMILEIGYDTDSVVAKRDLTLLRETEKERTTTDNKQPLPMHQTDTHLRPKPCLC